MKRLVVCLSAGFVIALAILAVSPKNALALDEHNCLVCHGKSDLVKTDAQGRKISLYVDAQHVKTSAHRYVDCTACHTTDPHKVATPLTKLSLAEKCGTCHQYEYKLHLSSIHGQQLAQGNPDVATCVDCHSQDSNPHNVIRVLEFNAPTYKKNIAETCGKCHNDKALMADYGIVEKVYESYMRSFHGKAIQLSSNEIAQVQEATCTNCHGFHDVKSVTNPSSPVSGLDNLAKTCEQCHVGAGTQFAAGFLGHKEASRQNVAPVHYAEIIFRIVLTSVIIFGFLVVITAIVRFTLNRWRE